MIDKKISSYPDCSSLACKLPSVEREKRIFVTLFTCLLFVFISIAEGAPLTTTRSDVPLKVFWDYQDAKEALAKKRWPESIIILRRILNTTPQWKTASIQLAKALLYSGRREEALSVLEKAKLMNQHRVLSRLFLTQETSQIYQEGLSLIHEKKYRAGRERFLKALEKEPDNLEILLRVGQCFVLEGDPDSAVEKLYFARKLGPFEPETRLWLGRALFLRGEIKKALGELRAADQELQGSELAPLWYAEALHSMGQRLPAIRLLEEDIKKNPFHLNALVSLANLKFQTSNKNKTILWSIRKDLQLALSRLDHYASPKNEKIEGELGIDLRDKSFIQTESNTLLSRTSVKLGEFD